MKKLTVLLLVLSLALMSLTACGNNGAASSTPPETSDETAASQAEENVASQAEENDLSETTDEAITITWLAQGPGDNLWEGKTKPLLEKYKEETGVEVVGEFYSFADLLEVIEVKIASGSSDYDVICVDVPLVAAYASRGYLKSIDEYFTDDEKAGYIDSALAAGTWEGSFYAPPIVTSSQLLYYNKDLLEQAGITIPEADVANRLTWEQVEQMAKETLDVVDPDRNQGINGISFQQISRTYQMCALPNSKGSASIGEDGLTVSGIINDQGWLDAMTWYGNLYNEGTALRGISATETNDYFNSGKTIFMVGGTWTPSLIGDTNYGVIPCPAFEGYEGDVATPTGSWHLGVNASSEHEAAAADFIKWLTLGEGNAMFLELFGDVPSTKAAIEAIDTDPAATDVMKIAAYEAANTAVPRPVTPGYNEYSSVMDAAFEDIRNGTDPKEALDSAVEQIESQFARYK